ncbi:hypothetical protein D3C72_1080710 [compost metagenome]
MRVLLVFPGRKVIIDRIVKRKMECGLHFELHELLHLLGIRTWNRHAADDNLGRGYGQRDLAAFESILLYPVLQQLAEILLVGNLILNNHSGLQREKASFLQFPGFVLLQLNIADPVLLNRKTDPFLGTQCKHVCNRTP